jgi:hypothetical protein
MWSSGRGARVPFRARVRWIDPATKRPASKSESFGTVEQAQDWIDDMIRAAQGGLDPNAEQRSSSVILDQAGSIAVVAPSN